MRDLLKTGIRRLPSAWLWALALLVLPNCTLDRSGLGTPHHLLRGALPHGDAIMCDIERYQGPTRRCATASDLAIGVPLNQAAEALVTGVSGNIALDYSAAAQAACGLGNPQAIDMEGAFPDGRVVCINCADSIPTYNADATAVCVNECRDVVERESAPTPPDIVAFCTANAKPSTHFPDSGCFNGACSTGGTLVDGFVDPRRTPEPVVWTDLIGTIAVGNNLTRNLPTSPGEPLDAGAVSTQWVHHGDAYVEFEASENNLSHIIGFSSIPSGCPFPCHDSDTGISNLPFAIALSPLGHVVVVENGAQIMGPDVDGNWGTYVAGERFRVRLRDNNDGTAQVTYSRIVGACVAGMPCNESPFYTSVAPAAQYPLRVDTAFRHQNATLANVTFVRIE